MLGDGENVPDDVLNDVIVGVVGEKPLMNFFLIERYAL